MTYFFSLAFLAILAALGTALFFMLRGGANQNTAKTKSKRMAWALALRVGISVFLFIVLWALWYFGLIQPTGIPPGA